MVDVTIQENVGYLGSRESGRVHTKIREKSTETEEIAGLVSVPDPEPSGRAFTPTTAQSYMA
ncbi:hypothetical protein EOD39_16432 [Acipenser ruthenus]|uniref:Uncharacterized protein n=1 Tax=Acipenser ruthenus TaxID=7906 RepID=A0A444V5Y4_ACIRT|nr:hypothetical protein EOD39_16432 [Acipenser ruthenus]